MLRIFAGQGQDRIVVLKQHDAFFFQVLGDIQPAYHINDAFLDGIVHNAGKEFGVKNPTGMVINFGHRNLAVFYCLHAAPGQKNRPWVVPGPGLPPKPSRCCGYRPSRR